MPQAKFDLISDKQVMGWFFQRYDPIMETSWVNQLAIRVDSNVAVEEYAGLGNAPAMREWIAMRLMKSLREYRMLVRNKDYEATLEIFRKDLRRDRTGQLQAKIGELAERAAEHDEKLLSNMIDIAMTSTATTLSYDGQIFFDTDHAVGDSGSMSNDISVDISALTTGTHGTVTAPSAGEMAGAIQAGVSQFFTFKDDQGEPVNGRTSQILIMVPPGLWSAAEQALTAPAFGGGETNPIFGSSIQKQLVVNPRLTWTDEFAIFRTDGIQKPFLIQVEEAPVFEVVGEGSEYAFDYAAHKYGVRKSGAVAPWDFTKAVLVTLI